MLQQLSAHTHACPVGHVKSKSQGEISTRDMIVVHEPAFRVDDRHGMSEFNTADDEREDTYLVFQDHIICPITLDCLNSYPTGKYARDT
jgi:SUMO ligase MMS21 Smc5/6 complex component